MGGINLGGLLKDPLVTLDPGGLVYKSKNPDTLALQGQLDVGGIGAKKTIAQQAANQAQQTASQLQANSATTALQEQQRQFDTMVNLMSPYTSAGYGALTGQQNLLGLNGVPAQQTAIDNISNSPQYQSMLQQGENAILQNASATGGLRGGNTQAALAQFRPQMLNQLINQQYSNLGGLTNMGQASAAGQAQMGQNTANAMSPLYIQQGAAQAGGQLANASYALAQANNSADTLKTIGTVAAMFF